MGLAWDAAGALTAVAASAATEAVFEACEAKATPRSAAFEAEVQPVCKGAPRRAAFDVA